METSIWRALFYLVGIMAFAALNAAYLVWCERKGAARIQRRSGPTEVGYEGLLQPLAEGRLSLAQLVDAAPGELWLQPRLEGPRLLYRAGLAESGRSWAVEAELSLTTEQRQSLQRATAAQVALLAAALAAARRRSR